MQQQGCACPRHNPWHEELSTPKRLDADQTPQQLTTVFSDFFSTLWHHGCHYVSAAQCSLVEPAGLLGGVPSTCTQRLSATVTRHFPFLSFRVGRIDATWPSWSVARTT
eukprot:2847144-Amphidinium_carterae.1